MGILEKQVDALMRFCTAKDPETRKEAEEEVRFLLQGRRRICTDPEYLIRQLLLELGAPDHLVGHPYVVEGILMALQDRMYIDSITFGLYPQLAAKFDTTASRVERAIRHLIEVTWTRGDLDTLNRYFGCIANPGKGKPTNGEFLARMVNIIKQKLREAE